jgi:hypothetical protein
MASGEITPEDIHGYIQAVAQDDRIKSDFRELFDVRSISTSRVTTESFTSVRELVMNCPKRTPGSLLAIVVGTGSSFDKARTYESVTSPDVQDVIVFNDIHTAETWLGVTDIETEP